MSDDKSDRVGDALDRDWEQTKSDLPGLDGKDLDQDAGDTVRPRAKNPCRPRTNRTVTEHVYLAQRVSPASAVPHGGRGCQ
jgi:hypothetical protein